MKKTALKLLLLAITLFATIALTGFIKFNYFDIPYLGDPVTYQSQQGDSIIVSNRVDGSIQLALPNKPRTILIPFKTASESTYQNQNDSLIFWQKDNKFTVKKSGKILYQGQRLD